VWLYVKKPEGVIKNEQRSVNYTSRVTSQRKYQPPRIVFDVLVASQNLFKILKIHISKLKCTCVQNMIRCIIHYKKIASAFARPTTADPRHHDGYRLPRRIRLSP
jgi:hypothetical protein